MPLLRLKRRGTEPGVVDGDGAKVESTSPRLRPRDFFFSGVGDSDRAIGDIPGAKGLV